MQSIRFLHMIAPFKITKNKHLCSIIAPFSFVSSLCGSSLQRSLGEWVHLMGLWASMEVQRRHGEREESLRWVNPPDLSVERTWTSTCWASRVEWLPAQSIRARWSHFRFNRWRLPLRSGSPASRNYTTTGEGGVHHCCVETSCSDWFICDSNWVICECGSFPSFLLYFIHRLNWRWKPLTDRKKEDISQK